MVNTAQVMCHTLQCILGYAMTTSAKIPKLANKDAAIRNIQFIIDPSSMLSV
jgi:hypothetical protein